MEEALVAQRRVEAPSRVRVRCGAAAGAAAGAAPLTMSAAVPIMVRLEIHRAHRQRRRRRGNGRRWRRRRRRRRRWRRRRVERRRRRRRCRRGGPRVAHLIHERRIAGSRLDARRRHAHVRVCAVRLGRLGRRERRILCNRPPESAAAAGLDIRLALAAARDGVDVRVGRVRVERLQLFDRHSGAQVLDELEPLLWDVSPSSIAFTHASACLRSAMLLVVGGLAFVA